MLSFEPGIWEASKPGGRGTIGVGKEAPKALNHFDEALAVPEGDRWPFDWARARLLYGEHLHRVRRDADARTQLRAAADIFNRLGAHPWAARATDRLRAAGAQVAPRGGDAAGALTAHQLRIAKLAASGLTNKQIGQTYNLSHRTVGAVLYQVYRTLGVTSRSALAGALGSSQAEPAE